MPNYGTKTSRKTILLCSTSNYCAIIANSICYSSPWSASQTIKVGADTVIRAAPNIGNLHTTAMDRFADNYRTISVDAMNS